MDSFDGDAADKCALYLCGQAERLDFRKRRPGIWMVHKRLSERPEYKGRMVKENATMLLLYKSGVVLKYAFCQSRI